MISSTTVADIRRPIARAPAALILSLLVLVSGASSAAAQICIIESGGCGGPNQCFPGIIGGPWAWQEPGSNHTWQLRGSLQSPSNSCEPPLGTTFPFCCSGYSWNPPPAPPGPAIKIYTKGTRVMVDYDAPNLFCGVESVGDWPIGITCFNDPTIAPDRLTLYGAGGLLDRSTYIYFENGTWDTGKDIPCGATVSYQAEIRYAANNAPPITTNIAATALTQLTGQCADREQCGGAPAAGLPINLGSGDVTMSLPLFGLSQEPKPLPFTLVYHSGQPMFPALMASPVGAGWSHEYAQTLRPEDATNDRLYHVTADGREREYLRTAPNTFWRAIVPAELQGTIVQSGSTYALTDLNGNTTSFDVPTGRWVSTRDRWGNTISGTYSTGQLTTIPDSMGRQIQLAYTSGLVTITLPNSKTWKLTLGGGNLLTAIRDPLHASSDWRTFYIRQ